MCLRRDAFTTMVSVLWDFHTGVKRRLGIKYAVRLGYDEFVPVLRIIRLCSEDSLYVFSVNADLFSQAATKNLQATADAVLVALRERGPS